MRRISHCVDCGKKILNGPLGPLRKRCNKHFKIYRNAYFLARNHKAFSENPALVKKLRADWYIKNRKNNQDWIEENKRRAKAWRASNARKLAR
jgi:hypothetical protein